MSTSLPGVVPVQLVLPCESLLSLSVANASDDLSHLFWLIVNSAAENGSWELSLTLLWQYSNSSMSCVSVLLIPGL